MHSLLTLLLLFSTAIITLADASPLFSKLSSSTNNIQLSYQILEPIFDNKGKIQIHWQNSNQSSDLSLDWISLWWYPFKGTYIQYFNVTSLSGSFVFENVLNIRTPYIIQYFRGNTSLARTEQIHPVAHVPMQIRLALDVDGYTDMLEKENKVSSSGLTPIKISWTCDRVQSNSGILLGTSPDNLDQQYFVETSGVTTYNASQLNQRVKLPPIQPQSTPFANIYEKKLRCGWLPPPIGTGMPCWDDTTATALFVDPGVFLSVTIFERNLRPNTRYYYQVGEIGGGIMSSIRSFVTAPSSFESENRHRKNDQSTTMMMNSPDFQTSILYAADLGTGPVYPGFEGGALHNDIRMLSTQKQAGARFVLDTISTMLKSNQFGEVTPTLFLQNGDVDYSRGWPYISESYHNLTSNGIFDSMPVLTTFGNHDVDIFNDPSLYERARCGDSGGEGGIVIGSRFNLNINRPWYFQRHGPVFFILLSSEHKMTPQVNWMREYFVSPGKNVINRTHTPWVVVALHRPLYSLQYPDNQAYEHHLATDLADLFTEIGVDLVLQGHQHQYARFCAISSEHCNTWGFRDVYTTYQNVIVAPSSEASCFLESSKVPSSVPNVNECRVLCNLNAKCSGVQFNTTGKNNCQLLKCSPLAIGINLIEYIGSQKVLSLQRLKGDSPRYIVDGTGGAQFSPMIIKNDPRVKYADEGHFGFSEIVANKTNLIWRHYHAPGGKLADDLMLLK